VHDAAAIPSPNTVSRTVVLPSADANSEMAQGRLQLLGRIILPFPFPAILEGANHQNEHVLIPGKYEDGRLRVL